MILMFKTHQAGEGACRGPLWDTPHEELDLSTWGFANLVQKGKSTKPTVGFMALRDKRKFMVPLRASGYIQLSALISSQSLPHHRGRHEMSKCFYNKGSDLSVCVNPS